MERNWAAVAIPWSDFRRVEWEENPGESFSGPERISGLAIGFGTEEEGIEGTVWVDDLGWLGMEAAPVQSVGDERLIPDEREEEREPISWVLIAAAGLVLAAGGVGILVYRKVAAGRR
jgi:hypothetical protein